MTIVTHSPKITEPICPSWCSGHNTESYQTWFPYIHNSMARDHGDEGVVVGGTAVHVMQVETSDAGMDSAKIYVSENTEDIESNMLTPTQARELAAVLLTAADRIDAEGGR